MTLPEHVTVPGLSGERFRVIYHLTGDEAVARDKAAAICVEQTIEFPGDLAPLGDIRDHIIGQVERFAPLDDGRFEAVISYAVEVTGGELTQLLNVVFGNSSIKPGIRVERLELSDGLLAGFKGPRFGQSGLRDYVKVYEQPLLCMALKPMGLSAEVMAELAYQIALGGIHIIKDDHGLTDQPFCRFEDRVGRCAEAVAKANRETGQRCIYMPNVTAPAHLLMKRARFAKDAGAGGLMVSPGLVGLDTMRMLADDDRLALPIMSHPALQGSFVMSPECGISHYTIYGQIVRLAGGDATIYPN
jgi:ribulose-bisphosphate carboxylase large chain